MIVAALWSNSWCFIAIVFIAYRKKEHENTAFFTRMGTEEGRDRGGEEEGQRKGGGEWSATVCVNCVNFFEERSMVTDNFSFKVFYYSVRKYFSMNVFLFLDTPRKPILGYFLWISYNYIFTSHTKEVTPACLFSTKIKVTIKAIWLRWCDHMPS